MEYVTSKPNLLPGLKSLYQLEIWWVATHKGMGEKLQQKRLPTKLNLDYKARMVYALVGFETLKVRDSLNYETFKPVHFLSTISAFSIFTTSFRKECRNY